MVFVLTEDVGRSCFFIGGVRVGLGSIGIVGWHVPDDDLVLPVRSGRHREEHEGAGGALE